MPNKYGHIEEIAQYNRDTGTNFYRGDQVQQHKKENNPIRRFLNQTVQVPVTSGTATGVATTGRDIPKVDSTVGQELGYAAGLITTPMLFGEFAAGAVPGIIKIGGGMTGAAAGSYAGKKVGDFADNLFGTTVLGDIGGFVGGGGGGGAGSKFAYNPYTKALPTNIRSFTKTLTKQGKANLQKIADDTYSTLADRSFGIAKTHGFEPSVQNVDGTGLPKGSIINTKDASGNVPIRMDFTNSDLSEMFGVPKFDTKIKYVFQPFKNTTGFDANAGGITINRANFLFPFKDSQGQGRMLNAGKLTGDANFLVGHESGHLGMSQINPMNGRKPFKLNNKSNSGFNPENKIFETSDFGLSSNVNTHNQLPEEYLSDYFGELAQRGISQDTSGYSLPTDVKTSIIKNISSRRGLSLEDTNSLLNSMSNYGYISKRNPISEAERAGIPKGERPLVKDIKSYLNERGFALPRKHLQGDDAVQMFKEYGAQYPQTTRLYRVTGTSSNFTPSPDGTAEYAGQGFTNDPNKVLLYGSSTAKKARIAGIENPIELQVVDVPTSQLERYRASNIIKKEQFAGDFEPEDFLIPLDMQRGKAPMNFTGNILADSKLTLPEISAQDTPLMQQLRKYVPEVRERYGLVGNNAISDEEIAGSLYKKATELGGDTAAVNEVGEPLILFRGDTKRFPALRKVAEPESLAKGTGSMDNSFGNLFLGQLDRPGEGVERYIHYVHQYPGGATEVFPSATGERIIWDGNKLRTQGEFKYIPEKYLTYDLSKPFNEYGQQVRVRKISSDLAKPNANDINAFVVRTPSIRNASSEISPEMGGEFIDINGVPKFKNSSYVDREQSAKRIRQILDEAKSKQQGLLKSDAYSPLRENEHFEYDYYALPNFNIRGAKHLLPYDFRIKPQGESRLIYRKQGGTINE